MRRQILRWFVLPLLVLSPSCSTPTVESLPSVSEAAEVLKDFRGEYSYGGLGLGAQSNNGELAVWIIFRATNAVEILRGIYPACQPSGKAYVLAALQRIDTTAFRSLTNDFCQEPGKIITGAGCIESSISRAELVAEMQDGQSGWGFIPSRSPRRYSSVKFFKSNRDVYEAQRQWEREQQESSERAYAMLGSNPSMAAFTNLFRVEEARDERGQSLGFRFAAGREWSAHLIPREKLKFETMVEAIFPESNGVAEVKIVPEEVFGQLKALADLPFMRKLDESIPITCIRIRAAGDRYSWDTNEVNNLEAVLKTGVPVSDWTRFIVDAGSNPKRMICFYHPKDTDTYVVDDSVLENPN